jgi:hypothetical protein
LELEAGTLSLWPEKVFDNDEGRRENLLVDLPPAALSLFFRLKPNDVRLEESIDFRGPSLFAIGAAMLVGGYDFWGLFELWFWLGSWA